MWKVVTNSNLNPPLKLFFYSPILINNNMFLKIYCKNIVVTFINYDFLFIMLFLLSQPSFHQYVFLFVSFFFFFSSTHVVLISIPLLLFSLSFKNVPGAAFILDFFSPALSLSFFFYLTPALSFSLSLFFFSSTLSLSLSLSLSLFLIYLFIIFIT